MKSLFIFLFTLLVSQYWAQDSSVWVTFHPSQKQILGFDLAKTGLPSNFYPSFQIENGKSLKSSFKILAKGKSDFVEAHFHGDSTFDFSKVEFYFGNEKLEHRFLDSFRIELYVNNPTKSNDLLAYSNGKKIGQLKTMVYEKKSKKIILIPLGSKNLDFTLIKNKLVSIYKRANIDINLQLAPVFKSKVFDEKITFSNPDSLLERYTGQMRLLRDQYFLEHPNSDRNAFYIFIIPGFTNMSLEGYMVPDKAIGFLPYQDNFDDLGLQLARTLAKGMGGLNNNWIRDAHLITSNLMDTTKGVKLTHFQITELQRDMTNYSRLDAFEYVKTGNGTIAYYFWEEDENGNIYTDANNFLGALHQPFKQNFIAYRFDVQYSIMKPFFRFGKYYISILNFIFITLISLALFYFRKRLKRRWSEKKWGWVWRRIIFWCGLSLSIYLIVLSFGWGNDILEQFKKVSGPMPSLSDLTYRDAKRTLFKHPEIRKQGEANLYSEILIRRNNEWEVKKRGQVLYFELQERDTLESPILRLVSTSDSLIVAQDSIRAFARTHYSVYTRKNSKGEQVSQEVYTYDGKKVVDFKNQKDAPRRVLVFVNGYRPTSTGQTFGENFKGIQAKGFEFPNSTNFIYNFDRYDYWEPWGEINQQFQNRINPSITYYADGHFSVSTSDYESLLNFTRISQLYPLRCENPNKHACYTVENENILRFILPTSQTEKLLKMKANTKGFEYRKTKGKIAGMNLLQEMNPFPNSSENDTLFIVAHSMGFAYSLGMVEVLRDKINFGGFYIIAPENAKSGSVNPEEWQQIWQYGSRFNLPNSDAPCLQDGVAPQSGVKGLPVSNRVFIPKELYNRKGFFDSHFIGYYDWILKLQEGEVGYMKQR